MTKTVSIREMWRLVCRSCWPFFEEVYVPDMKYPCPPHFFRGVSAKIFTGAHGKEDGGRV